MSLRRIGKMGIKNTQSRTSSLTVASGLPGMVTGLTATSIDYGVVALSWSAPSLSGESSISSYIVSVSPDPGASIVYSGTSASVSNLSPSNSYTFSVKAVNSIGFGNSLSQGHSTPAINAASGGTEEVITNYNGTGQTWKTHRFTGAGTLTVSASNYPSRVLVVGGGGGGGGGTCGTGQCGCSGGGGGSGGYYHTTKLVSVGSLGVTIGNYGSPSSAGGSSVFDGLTATGGAGGSSGSGGAGGTPNGNAGVYRTGSNSGYLTSDITGTSTLYAVGGYSCARGSESYYGGGGRAADRTGGDYPDGTGSNGGAGIVILAYRVA